MTDTLVIATRNPGKLREFHRLMAGRGWRLLSLDDAGFAGELEEPGTTYAENAAAKSDAACRATGSAALGDDSGIEVVALNGWPGPASARWMGSAADDEDRLRGLVAEVERHCPGDRRVRYVAALALSRPGAEPVVAHGRCAGVLVSSRGANGFGYDPGFLSDDLGLTFAEAGDGAKDLVSHRARALARLAACGLLDPGGAAHHRSACS